MKRAGILLTVVVVCVLGAASCGDDGDGNGGNGTDVPTATAPAQATSVVDESLPPVIEARAAMGISFDTPPAEITVLSVEEATFSDACLDVTSFVSTPEVCAQVITPGYIITMQVGSTVATYHSDEAGTNVRFADVDVGGGNREDTATP